MSLLNIFSLGTSCGVEFAGIGKDKDWVSEWEAIQATPVILYVQGSVSKQYAPAKYMKIKLKSAIYLTHPIWSKYDMKDIQVTILITLYMYVHKHVHVVGGGGREAMSSCNGLSIQNVTTSLASELWWFRVPSKLLDISTLFFSQLHLASHKGVRLVTSSVNCTRTFSLLYSWVLNLISHADMTSSSGGECNDLALLAKW